MIYFEIFFDCFVGCCWGFFNVEFDLGFLEFLIKFIVLGWYLRIKIDVEMMVYVWRVFIDIIFIRVCSLKIIFSIFVRILEKIVFIKGILVFLFIYVKYLKINLLLVMVYSKWGKGKSFLFIVVVIL